MTSNKVYVVEAKTNDPRGWSTPADSDTLGKAIGAIAKNVNTPVFFHEHVSDLLGGSHFVLLECSDAFLNAVKKLPEFEKAYEDSSGHATKRSAALWSYFTGSPPTPSRGVSAQKPPKPKM